MMNVIDIRKTAELAKKHNLLLIVDNTFLSPYFQRPFELGADIILHSGTKFLSGHNDTLAGFIVVNTPELSEKLRYIIKTTGAGLAPFDSWLVLRGIKTLPIRMEKAQENAQAIVEFLLQEKKVKNVYYPGIPGTNNYEVCKSQASGFGSMLTFEVESKELALHILESLKLIPFAESLGGVETLITYLKHHFCFLHKASYDNLRQSCCKLLKDLNCTLLCNLSNTLYKLLTFHRIHLNNSAEMLRRKCRDSFVLVFLTRKCKGITNRE